MDAKHAIVETDVKVRHTYCERHFREALSQCPLTDAEKVRVAKAGEQCEECPLPGDSAAEAR